MKTALHLLGATLLSAVSLATYAATPNPAQWQHEGITYSGEYTPETKGYPGIVIIHQWMGLTDHERKVAAELNRLGYPVLAADLYGEGVRPKNREEAKATAGAFYADRSKFRNRGAAAVKEFSRLSGLAAKDVFVIGYCFGGTAALELARTGLAARGFVSLHGGLANPKPDDDARIRGRVLILHGAEDQSVSFDDVNALIASLREYRKDFSVHVFADAVHGFTHANDPERYNEKADKRSWRIMLDFFRE